MPTQTKENYLKAIYMLDQQDDEISLTDLSKMMEVSTPTVNNMVKRLQENGWVIYKKYKPLKLTDKGRKAAALIVRKHRLAEMYLVERMGFGWEEVHDIAEDMEHIQSDIFFDRMDELLGYPPNDPHGSPIPDKSGRVQERSKLPLSKIKPGTTVRLQSLSSDDTDLLLFLNKRSIKLGTEIRVNRIEAFDQSVIISYDDHNNVSLSPQVAQTLLVEKLE